MDINAILEAIDGAVWGVPLIVLIIACGVWLTFRVRFLQVRHLGKALKFMVKNEEGGEGEVTSFGALCTALSATIGTGNIVGVASAIAAGGPGALFWMLVAAFFGMATKYSEGLLAIKYREVDADGHVLGGPFYYIEKGMGKNWKWMGKLFALFGVLAGALGIGTITQINGITSAAQNFFDPDKAHVVFTLAAGTSSETPITMTTIVVGLIVTVCAGLVIIGGIKRIAKVSEVVVPFMAVAYVLFAVILLLTNLSAVPHAIYQIVYGAFHPEAVAGGIVGVCFKVALQKGVARGIFSNEAGLGSAPIAAAAAKTNEPVRQGLVTMTGTFIDTIIICTMTGLSIVISGGWQPDLGLEGASITMYAFENCLPGSCGRLHPDDVPGVLRLHHHPGLELLRRALHGVPLQRQQPGREDLSLDLYRRRVRRPLPDGFRRVDHRRYFQRTYGHPEHRCFAGPVRCHCKNDERIFRPAKEKSLS